MYAPESILLPEDNNSLAGALMPRWRRLWRMSAEFVDKTQTTIYIPQIEQKQTCDFATVRP